MIDRFWKGNIEFGNLDNKVIQNIEDILFERNSMGHRNGFFRRMYYSLKPLVPRFVQIYLRKMRAKDIEDNGYISVESIYRQILAEKLKTLNKSFHFIGFWPKGYKMAGVITHDVETAEGLTNVFKLAEIDEKFGISSSFEFVPERYRIDPGTLKELRNRGFENAVHGLRHDGKLFNSEKLFKERLSKIEQYAEEWGAEGFRSPSLLRNASWMKDFNFSWDSSFPDWDMHGPQPGGCRTALPFFLSENTIELPVTMMQDHTLFEILGKNDIEMWKEKVEHIESLNGLVNIIVHPDYIFVGNRIDYYRLLLDYLKSRGNIWFALPREIADWWRRRDGSNIKFASGRKPYIVGPASEDGVIASAELLSNELLLTLNDNI